MVYRAGIAFGADGALAVPVTFTSPLPNGDYAVSVMQVGGGNVIILPMCFRASARTAAGFVIQPRDCTTGQLTPLSDNTELAYIAVPSA